MSKNELPEPWLRGTLQDVPAVQRAVVHALQLAGEDLQRWCGGLSDQQINARPGGVAPVAFHLRHIARSLDRLLTYAEGRELDDEQLSTKQAEMNPGATCEELFGELNSALRKARSGSGRLIRVRWNRAAEWAESSCPRLSAGCWCIALIIPSVTWGKPLRLRRLFRRLLK